MIDRRELMEKARKFNLPLGIVEKDYVLGWMLYGIREYLPELVFKGGTALSKIYFPEVWRLSEDLDFNAAEKDNFNQMIDIFEQKILHFLEQKSGIRFQLNSKFSNSQYLQIKVQYLGVLEFRNFVKIDISKHENIEEPIIRKLKAVYSDYPQFMVKVKTLNEIFAAKVRTILERTKCRDYFDLWKLLDYVKVDEIQKLILLKCGKKEIDFGKLFEKTEELDQYWKREMPRLVSPVPELDKVLADLKNKLAANHRRVS